jgi:asparagine synthase (glutamine-hydrolysing)
MCGIAGIIGPGIRRRQLDSMLRIQHHRGPDENDIYFQPELNVGLAHNRLRILDLSSAGRQPMATPDGRLWITFNGEVYNYRELRSELGDYPFRSATDTEVILAAYQRWGPRCVEKFVGMFAFAIWDERERSLFCARDRLGVKPFFYAWHQGQFVFASEIKTLLAAGVPARPNLQVWATYLVHSYCDQDDHSFFEGIESLPPAHTLSLRDGRAALACYWNLPEIVAEIEPIADRDAVERFSALLEDSVRLRLRSDVRVGVNLSGGLDSAGLMIAVDRLAVDQSEIHTFTSAYDDRRYDETEFANEVPHRAEWVRHRNHVGPEDAWQVIDEVTWHQEAPFGGVSTLAHHRLHWLSREQQTTVLLEGQGVDELLAGYNYFRFPMYLDLAEAGNDLALQAEAKAHGDSPEKVASILQTLRAGATINVYQDGTQHLRPECISGDLRGLAGDVPQFPRRFSDHLRNWLYRDLRHTKLPRVLRMHDRLSMASSRELRVPFLDHRLVEFAFSLPADLRIRQGCYKFIFRHALQGRLKDELRLAPKRTVVNPQREWFRGVLRARIEAIINSKSFAERGLFNLPEVNRSFASFCAGEGDNSFFIWQWINTEAWFRRFVDRAAELVPAK